MSSDTKERIIEAALELFSQRGYMGTSMNDIASQIGITKAALYKHYSGKQEILDRIIEHMNEADAERAKEYGMPLDEPDGLAQSYINTPAEKIRAYSIAQFRHWTEDEFSARFRRMLTIEQYRDRKMTQLYQNYLASGPLEYMAAIFRRMTDSDAEAMQTALDFYAPMFMLYSIYDGAENKGRVMDMLEEHIDRFTSRMQKKSEK